MSIDAANRAWMQGPTYRAALRAGDAMETYTICEVVDSADPSLLKGDIVMAETCWADYSTLSARKVLKLFQTGPFLARFRISHRSMALLEKPSIMDRSGLGRLRRATL